jgi:hypothetical protein
MSLNLFGRKVPTKRRAEESTPAEVQENEPIKKKSRSDDQIQSAPSNGARVQTSEKSVDESMWKGQLQAKDQEIAKMRRQILDLKAENIVTVTTSQKKIEVIIFIINNRFI